MRPGQDFRAYVRTAAIDHGASRVRSRLHRRHVAGQREESLASDSTARRTLGTQGAWGVAALYCGSAYVIGVGGEREMIGGMTFASHIAPAAVTLAAFAALTRPMAAGALLATAMATLFWPAFLFPAWLGYYWRAWPDARKRGLRRGSASC